MSRMWDTSEIYARIEADELLRDFPNTGVADLTASFARSHPTYEQDPQFASEIVTELRKRADVNIRFWPDTNEVARIEQEVRAVIGSMEAFRVAEHGEPEFEAADAPGFWWQRM